MVVSFDLRYGTREAAHLKPKRILEVFILSYYLITNTSEDFSR